MANHGWRANVHGETSALARSMHARLGAPPQAPKAAPGRRRTPSRRALSRVSVSRPSRRRMPLWLR